MMQIPHKRVNRTLVQKGAIIDYYQDTIEIFDGSIKKFDFIGHNGAAAMLGVREDGRIVMVKQYRNALDRFTLEIPAGGLSGTDEPTMDGAIREFKEETGYEVQNVKLLLSLYTTVAFCNEKIDIYYGDAVCQGAQNLDEDEMIEILDYSLDELTEMVHNGTIMDGKTISAIMTYASLIK